jgi:hypothetical protein
MEFADTFQFNIQLVNHQGGLVVDVLENNLPVSQSPVSTWSASGLCFTMLPAAMPFACTES